MKTSLFLFLISVLLLSSCRNGAIENKKTGAYHSFIQKDSSLSQGNLKTDEKPVNPDKNMRSSFAISSESSDSASHLKTTSDKIKYSSLKDLYQYLEKPDQTFKIDAAKDIILILNEKTRLKIPASAFIIEKNGEPVKGSFIISAREYYNISDMIIAGLTTHCGNQILETGGMIHIEAKQDGNTCTLAPGRSIEIGFPYQIKKEGMEIFEGKKNDQGQITWQKPVNSDQEAVHVRSEIFTVVEEYPSFPGGEEERLKFLRDNIQYPQEAQKLGVQGKVFVTFVVEPDGSVTDPKILRGIGAGCDEEAIRVIKSMPKWIPGKQRGKPVRVQFNLPVKFSLGSDIDNRLKYPNDSAGAGRNSGILGRQLENQDYYYLTSFNLGWINCDRYIGGNNGMTDYSLDVMGTDSLDVVMVFRNMKAIVTPTAVNKNKVIFKNLPVNQPVTILGIKVLSGKVYFSIHDDNSSVNKTQWLNLKEISPEGFKKALQALDK